MSNLSFTYPHNHRLYRLALGAWRLALQPEVEFFFYNLRLYLLIRIILK
jgi:hypothetical protein